MKVFISYSHDSPEHAARVLALADQLIRDGLDCVLDQYVGDPPEGWPKWMERELAQADFVVVICTKTYHSRVMGTETPGKGLGVRWESLLTYQDIYDAGGENSRFLPIVFAAEQEQYIPKPLRGVTRYILDSEAGYDKLYRRLTGQHKTAKPPLGQPKILPQKERKPLFSSSPQPAETPGTNDVRLDVKIAELQKQWDLLSQKISQLERQKILTTDVEVKFDLEHRLADRKAELAELERQLDEFERKKKR
jgi:hypothetical protein